MVRFAISSCTFANAVPMCGGRVVRSPERRNRPFASHGWQLCNRHACQFREPKGYRLDRNNGTTGGKSRFMRRSERRPQVRNSASSTWGLDAETKELPAPSQRKAIALDIPFIGLRRYSRVAQIDPSNQGRDLPCEDSWKC